MNKKILIIEDNAEIRENTAELLEMSNFRVFTANDGYSGFELARKCQPDLIICDMMMPESDGCKFLKLAKTDEALRNIPLVFFSAGTLSSELQNGLVAEASGFLKKPFSEEELLATINQLLN